MFFFKPGSFVAKTKAVTFQTMRLFLFLSLGAGCLAFDAGCVVQAPALPSSCATEIDCQAELAAAKSRVDSCEGTSECREAYARRDEIVMRLSAVRGQQASAQAVEADREGKVNAQILADQARSSETEKARAQASRDWRTAAEQACSGGWSAAPCESAPPDVLPTDQAFCRTFCTTQTDRRKELAFHGAIDRCVATLKEHHGRGTPICTFDVPEEALQSLQSRGDDCAMQCANRARGELWVAAQGPVVTPRRPASSIPAPTSPASTPRPPLGAVGSIGVVDMTTPLFAARTDYDQAMQFAAAKDLEGYKSLVARSGIKANAGAEVRVLDVSASGDIRVMINDGVNMGKVGWMSRDRLKPEP